MEIKKTCANCIREIDIGVSLFRVDEGVWGTKNSFVPLENTLLFCCERCLRDYFDTGDLPSMPPKIP